MGTDNKIKTHLPDELDIIDTVIDRLRARRMLADPTWRPPADRRKEEQEKEALDLRKAAQALAWFGKVVKPYYQPAGWSVLAPPADFAAGE